MSLIFDALEKLRQEAPQRTPTRPPPAAPAAAPAGPRQPRAVWAPKRWSRRTRLRALLLVGLGAIWGATLWQLQVTQRPVLHEPPQGLAAEIPAAPQTGAPAEPAPRDAPELPAPAVHEAAFVVHGIVYEKGGDSWADVNGRLVREGEEIDGAMVEAIEPDRVSLRVNNQRLVVTVR